MRRRPGRFGRSKINPDRICKRCGEKIFNRSNNALYCKSCIKIVEKEQIRKYSKRSKK